MKERELPEGWKLEKIRDFCNTSTGGTPSRKEKEYYNGDIPWLKSGELKESVILSSEEHISKEGLLNSNAKIIPKGTLLIALYGATVGRVGILGIDSAINQAICAITPTKDVEISFLYYFLKASRNELLKRRTGGAQPNISQGIINDIEVPIPPLETQKKIVAILEKAERIQRLREEADALTESLLQSVFLEMFGDPVTNPKEFNIQKFGDCCEKIIYGVGTPPEFSDSGIPFIRATNIKNGMIVRKNLKFISLYESQKISKAKVNKGDLIIVRSGVNTGDCTAITEEFDGSFAGYDLIVQLKPGYESNYFNLLINSDYGKKIISLLSRRAAQSHLNAKQVASLQFPVPPVELQREFSKNVKKILKISKIEENSNFGANLFNRAIMMMAFTGELVS